MSDAILKHSTAGIFLFHKSEEDGQWRIGLVNHPRLGKWLSAGGHVETNETPYEAAIRETREETGITDFTIIEPAPVNLPIHYRFGEKRVPLPWWMNEHISPTDNTHKSPHIHIDHLYVAIANNATPAEASQHAFKWYTREELVPLNMFEGSRSIINMMLPVMDYILADTALAKSVVTTEPVSVFRSPEDLTH